MYRERKTWSSRKFGESKFFFGEDDVFQMKEFRTTLIYTSEELTEKPTVYIDWCVFIFNQKKHRQILSKSLWQKHGMVRHPPRVDGSLHRCSVAFHMSLQSQGFFHNIKEKITGLGVILSYQLFVCNWLLLPFWLLTSSSAPPKKCQCCHIAVCVFFVDVFSISIRRFLYMSHVVNYRVLSHDLRWHSKRVLKVLAEKR